MSYFREILRCRECGKIYRSSYFPGLHASHLCDDVCGKCGAKNELEYVIAKPRLFGLKGWGIKEGKDE